MNFAVHPSVRETTKRVHLATKQRTPVCTVLAQDGDNNGLVKRLRLTKRLDRVTCMRCRKAAKGEGR